MREILEGGAGLPDFGEDEEEEEFEEDAGLNNQELYRQIQDTLGGAAKGFDYGDEEAAGQIIDGGDLDDEEFLAMMEQEAAHGRMLRGDRQQNSTIINSSQNTSLEDNFE